MKKAKLSFAKLRRMDSFQKELFQETWQHFRDKREWPILRSLYSAHGKQRVRKALSDLTGNVGYEQAGPRRWSRYGLNLLGVLLTNDGPHLQELLLRAFQVQRELFQKEPTKELTTSEEIKARFDLSHDDTGLLGELVVLSNMSGGWDHQTGTWSMVTMEEAADFPQAGDLSAEVEQWVFRSYIPDATVFQDQSRRAQYFDYPLNTTSTASTTTAANPAEIGVSLERLRTKYPDTKKLGFLMMRFSAARPFKRIVEVIKKTAEQHGLIVLRADEREFHAELWGNVRTLLHGCAFGIAVYERIQTNEPNANVGLEVGYLMAMNKPVLLLKDQTASTLQTDLVGTLFRNFDPHAPGKTIPKEMTKWLNDNGIVVPKRA